MYWLWQRQSFYERVHYHKRKQANNDKNEKHARALNTNTLSAVERKRKMTVTAQLLQPNGLTIDVKH